MQDPVFIERYHPPSKDSTAVMEASSSCDELGGNVKLNAGIKKTKIDTTTLPSVVAFSSAPNERYLWNKYLLDPVGGFIGSGAEGDSGSGEQTISQVCR